eukprot:NODE_638_length_1988_cov_67.445459_g484_i1.p1 GENE.NODE_638_length_1988_cov_67.445459_g484_i1~~NODE_638_length_1988_cov_67.445459_g484_i1.p1  ORF type:complete len:637 (-),score=148.77 NODE_638_length_1988_cov_67.445459_g484_i1:76-1947(-)
MPPLPTYVSSLSDVVTFYASNSPDLSSIPCQLRCFDVSPNQLQQHDQRFPMKRKQRFEIFNSPACTTTKEEIQKVKLEKDLKKFLFFKGPQGVGKSYALVHALMKLRERRDKYRVLFVNNPPGWIEKPYEYFLREVCCAFAPDADAIPGPPESLKHSTNDCPLLQWCESVMETSNASKEKTEMMMNALMRQLWEYCNSKKLKLVAVFDQDNVFCIPKHSEILKSFPFTLIDTIPAHLCVLSASALNEKGSSRYGYRDNVRFLNWGFTADEADPFLNSSLAALLSSQPSTRAIQLEACRLATGCMPFELRLLVQEKGDTITEKIANYSDSRYAQLAKSSSYAGSDGRHSDWVDGLLRPERYNQYLRDLQYLDLVSPLEASTAVFPRLQKEPLKDSQLSFYDTHTKTYHSMFPVARRVLLDDLLNANLEPGDLFSALVDKLAKNPEAFDGDVRGRIFERYIIFCLRKAFHAKRCVGFTFSDSSTMKVVLDDVITFPGLHPPKPSPNQTTLLIPDNANYRDVDMFLVVKKKVFVFQVTTNIASHLKSADSLAKRWDETFGSIFGDTYEFVWLGQRPPKKKPITQRVIHFVGLDREVFPLLVNAICLKRSAASQDYPQTQKRGKPTP